MTLKIIDCLTPFFELVEKKDKINWSEIPFGQINKIFYRQLEAKALTAQLALKFKKYLIKIKSLGYNGVILDDLAHMVNLPFLNKRHQKILTNFRQLYSRLIKICRQADIEVWVNTDYMFSNKQIEKYCQAKKISRAAIFKLYLRKIFKEYPVAGIIVRIGESDGTDVKDIFKSKLAIRKPEELNSFLKEILPVFEKSGKYLILRTWTVGAYQIGDLMWNKKTFLESFKQIRNRQLIISLKPAEADFFKYLELSKIFFLTDHQKMLELQARREYDGFGQIPNFIGWQYYRYLRQLKDRKDIIGISVWCQGGGWSYFKDLTFGKNSSIWNELNTYAILELLKTASEPAAIIRKFFESRSACQKKEIVEILELFEQCFRQLYYDLADQQFYFRRIRVPPVISVWWQTISVNSLTMAIFQTFNQNFSPNQAEKIIRQLKQKKQKLKKTVLYPSLNFGCRTMELIFLTRQYMRLPGQINYTKLINYYQKYSRQYPTHYQLEIQKPGLNSRIKLEMAKLLSKILIRKQQDYRLIDRVLLSPPAAKILLFFGKRLDFLPSFVNKEAMPIEKILS
ncbi:MAG: hypothetical protein JW991_01135 [Candidatus Pacebacteria bacterium]|nr:hypothetical protein [Candidatus Paceibacterota bacterium]